jgi:hypothetical protein
VNEWDARGDEKLTDFLITLDLKQPPLMDVLNATIGTEYANALRNPPPAMVDNPVSMLSR